MVRKVLLICGILASLLYVGTDMLAAMLYHGYTYTDRTAYHALSLGFFEGELLRRVDPQHRSLGQFFQDEIATPLGLDF